MIACDSSYSPIDKCSVFWSSLYMWSMGPPTLQSLLSKVKMHLKLRHLFIVAGPIWNLSVSGIRVGTVFCPVFQKGRASIFKKGVFSTVFDDQKGTNNCQHLLSTFWWLLLWLKNMKRAGCQRKRAGRTTLLNRPRQITEAVFRTT